MTKGLVIASGVAMALLTVACTDSGTPTATAPVVPISVSATTPPATTTVASTSTSLAHETAGGVASIAYDQEPPVLNPYLPGGDSTAVDAVSHLHMAGAFVRDPLTGELTADVVAEVPTAANGGIVEHADGTLSVTWTIRPDSFWSDGEPITGNDLAFTIEYQNAVARECFGALDRIVGSVQSVDEESLTFRFDEIGFEYEDALRWIVPEHTVAGEDVCTVGTDEPWPAAGPFEIEVWARGELITLARNDRYGRTDERGRALPYLDGVELLFVPELEDTAELLSSGAVDVAGPFDAGSDSDVGSYREMLESIDGVEVLWRASNVIEQIGMILSPNRVGQDPLFADATFRQGLAAAIDRETLRDTLGWGHRVDLIGAPWNQFDMSDAAVLMEEACTSVGRDCLSEPPRVLVGAAGNNEGRVAAVEQIAGRLEARGVDVEVFIDNAQYFGVPAFDRWDLTVYAVVEEPGMEARIAGASAYVDAPLFDGANTYWWGSPGSPTEGDQSVSEVRSLVDRLDATADHDEAVRLLAAIDEIVASEAIRIPIAGRPIGVAVATTRVAGVVLNPHQASLRSGGAGITWSRVLVSRRLTPSWFGRESGDRSSMGAFSRSTSSIVGRTHLRKKRERWFQMKVRPSGSVPMVIFEPSVKSPARTFIASGSAMALWRSRFRGRAPYTGS